MVTLSGLSVSSAVVSFMSIPGTQWGGKAMVSPMSIPSAWDALPTSNHWRGEEKAMVSPMNIPNTWDAHKGDPISSHCGSVGRRRWSPLFASQAHGRLIRETSPQLQPLWGRGRLWSPLWASQVHGMLIRETSLLLPTSSHCGAVAVVVSLMSILNTWDAHKEDLSPPSHFQTLQGRGSGWSWGEKVALSPMSIT